MRKQRFTICQVLHSLRVGGAEVLAAGLARSLRDRYRFVLACLEELGTLGEQLLAEGFRVEVVGRKAGIDFGCARRLGKLFRSEGVNMIHAHQYTPFFYASLGRWFCRRPPIVFTEHGRFFPDHRSPKRVLANRFLLERQDRVTSVGEFVKKALIQNEGIPSGRIGTIHNGIDVTSFRPCHNQRAAVREEMGATEEDFVIIQVARLDPIKDHETALRTVDQLRGLGVRPKLIIVGEGPEKQKIQTFLRQHHLEPHVRLLGLRTDIARLLSGADAFLLTSKSEGIPLTIIEAMGAGLPVVSTNVGGVAEVVRSGETGFVAPAGDASRLAHCLHDLAQSPPLRQRLGRAARQRASLLFSERRMVDSYVKLFDQVMAR